MITSCGVCIKHLLQNTISPPLFNHESSCSGSVPLWTVVPDHGTTSGMEQNIHWPQPSMTIYNALFIIPSGIINLYPPDNYNLEEKQQLETVIKLGHSCIIISPFCIGTSPASPQPRRLPSPCCS